MKGSRKIRLYPNRRLYDPIARTYISYDDIFALLRSGEDLEITDAEDESDCTRYVLLGLMVKRETLTSSGERALFGDHFLRELIRARAKGCPALIAEFLKHSLQMLEADPPGSQTAFEKEPEGHCS